MSTGTRRTATTVATATAAAAALTLMSAGTLTSASAHRPDPLAGSATQGVGSPGGTIDIGLVVAHRKARMAQYYVDHALELHQRNAR